MAQETSRGTRWALVALVFLHGGFVGGMIPLLNRELGETAPYAFSLYFAGMLLGQLLLWRIAALASPGWALGAYELFFAAAIVWMATHPSPMGITTGRFLEGVGSGLTLPLIFGHIVRGDAMGQTSKRLAVMSSAYAVGFICGPPLVTFVGAGLSTTDLLLAGAVPFAAIGLVLIAIRPGGFPHRSTQSVKTAWADLVPLLLAKCNYGYMMALIAARASTHWPTLGAPGLLLVLAVIFVAGQAAGVPLTRKLGLHRITPGLYVGVAAGSLGCALGGAPIAIFAIAGVHSLLLFVGYLRLADQPDEARRFALLNLLTDPGMLLGAVMAIALETGALGLVILAAASAVAHFKLPTTVAKPLPEAT